MTIITIFSTLIIISIILVINNNQRQNLFFVSADIVLGKGNYQTILFANQIVQDENIVINPRAPIPTACTWQIENVTLINAAITFSSGPSGQQNSLIVRNVIYKPKFGESDPQDMDQQPLIMSEPDVTGFKDFIFENITKEFLIFKPVGIRIENGETIEETPPSLFYVGYAVYGPIKGKISFKNIKISAKIINPAAAVGTWRPRFGVWIVPRTDGGVQQVPLLEMENVHSTFDCSLLRSSGDANNDMCVHRAFQNSGIFNIDLDAFSFKNVTLVGKQVLETNIIMFNDVDTSGRKSNIQHMVVENCRIETEYDRLPSSASFTRQARFDARNAMIYFQDSSDPLANIKTLAVINSSIKIKLGDEQKPWSGGDAVVAAIFLNHEITALQNVTIDGFTIESGSELSSDENVIVAAVAVAMKNGAKSYGNVHMSIRNVFMKSLTLSARGDLKIQMLIADRILPATTNIFENIFVDVVSAKQLLPLPTTPANNNDIIHDHSFKMMKYREDLDWTLDFMKTMSVKNIFVNIQTWTTINATLNIVGGLRFVVGEITDVYSIDVDNVTVNLQKVGRLEKQEQQPTKNDFLYDVCSIVQITTRNSDDITGGGADMIGVSPCLFLYILRISQDTEMIHRNSFGQK